MVFHVQQSSLSRTIANRKVPGLAFRSFKIGPGFPQVRNSLLEFWIASGFTRRDGDSRVVSKVAAVQLSRLREKWATRLTQSRL